MKQIKVRNPKLQRRLDALTGWREVLLVVLSVAATAAIVALAFKYKILP